MTAPNLPLSAEDLDIIEFNTDQDADDLTYLVDPRYFERIMTQSRTALDLAAQVAQARREALADVADTLIATAQVYREQGDAKTARVLEIVAQLYPDALATPEAGNE